MALKGLIISIVVVGLAVLGGCASSQSSGNDAGPPTCVAGQQVACACVDGRSGAQACKSDGSGFLACDCGDAAVSDSGSNEDAGDAATSTDASGDAATSTDASGDADSGGCVFNQNPSDTTDADHDGFSVAGGDCNDCDPNVYPGHGC